MAKKKSSTRKIMIFIGVLVGLLLVLAVVARFTGLFGERNNALMIEVASVELRRVTQKVTASGNVQPEVEVNISPDVSGEIIELNVNEGDPVSQGELLVRIRPDFYVAQTEQAEAGVLQAKATRAQRKADMLNTELEQDRQQTLFERGAVAESEYLRAKTQYDISKAAYEAADYAVQSAEARYRETREQLGKTRIYAPMNGTVSKLNVELGERVVGTSQMAGTEMMRIAKLDQMEMEVDVNENDVVNVSIGDTAMVEVDAYPDRTFRGVVTEIANSARTTAAGTQEQVTNFPVKIRLLDPHNLSLYTPSRSGEAITDTEVPVVRPKDIPNFRPGMSGTVDVYTRTIDDAVAVPIQAVTVRDLNALSDSTQADQPASTTAQEEDLRKVVFIMAEGKAEMIQVETGISDDTHIVVMRGLAGGEKVIIGPYRAVSQTLKPGTEVQLRDEGEQRGRNLATSE